MLNRLQLISVLLTLSSRATPTVLNWPIRCGRNLIGCRLGPLRIQFRQLIKSLIAKVKLHDAGKLTGTLGCRFFLRKQCFHLFVAPRQFQFLDHLVQTGRARPSDLNPTATYLHVGLPVGIINNLSPSGPSIVLRIVLAGAITLHH